MRCKFCGKRISTAKYLTPNTIGSACTECGKYCMDKCQTVYDTNTNWHTEPCIKCEKNPYQKQHKFDITKGWVKDE